MFLLVSVRHVGAHPEGHQHGVSVQISRKFGKTFPVRVKGGMSLRNGMWHGLRNDIIMRNVKYGKWRKELN